MTISLYFETTAFTKPNKLMGRHVAGANFLRAFCENISSNEFWTFVENNKDANKLKSISREYGFMGNLYVIQRRNLEDLKKPGLLYFPGPDIGQFSRLRSFFGASSWSLCGVTHTTATHKIMDGVLDLLLQPIEQIHFF